VNHICSDCGFPVTGVTEATIKRGSTVREPGEVLCLSCSASRSKMVRELDTIPNRIDLILAKRMVRGAA
jgi:hypothetical protein